jgi:hypothetical protein
MTNMGLRPALATWPQAAQVPHFVPGSKLDLTGDFVGFPEGFTLFTVLQPDPSDEDYRFIVKVGEGSSEYVMRLTVGGTIAARIEGADIGANDAYVEDRPLLISLRVEPNGERLLRVDRREARRNEGEPPSRPEMIHTPAVLGYNLNGSMAYMAIYDRAVDDAELDAMERALASRWTCCNP